MNPLNLYANNHFDPGLAQIAVAALDLMIFALMVFCVVQYRRARANAARAGAPSESAVELQPGLKFVSGKVEYAREAKYALRVTIEQYGTEIHSKNSTTHRFDEVGRKTECTPFYIKHKSGKRIRVEPEKAEVLLVDKLDQRHWTEMTRRWLRAELTPDELLIAEGELSIGHDPELLGSGEGYRDNSHGWVFKPRDGVLRVSTESLAKKYVLRANAFGKMIALLPMFWLGMQVPLATYRLRAWVGQDVEATYLGRSYWQTRGSKGGTTDHYAATFATHPDEAGRTVQDRIEIDSSDYLDLREVQTDRIWIRRVPGFELATNFGSGSTVHVGAWFATLLIAGVTLQQVLKRHNHKRWYEGKVSEDGTGTLPPPSNERFAEMPSRYSV